MGLVEEAGPVEGRLGGRKRTANVTCSESGTSARFYVFISLALRADAAQYGRATEKWFLMSYFSASPIPRRSDRHLIFPVILLSGVVVVPRVAERM